MMEILYFPEILWNYSEIISSNLFVINRLKLAKLTVMVFDVKADVYAFMLHWIVLSRMCLLIMTNQSACFCSQGAVVVYHVVCV